jgi:alpha-tubulin suppressor-like RCC1 family protein
MMGSNSRGQLGVGDPNLRKTASPLMVNLLGRPDRISCGDSHTAVVTEQGDLYAWGSG